MKWRFGDVVFWPSGTGERLTHELVDILNDHYWTHKYMLLTRLSSVIYGVAA